jgi:5'-methylthioinosine phosphorylase
MPTSSQPDAVRLAVIGGSGFYQLGLGHPAPPHPVATPYGTVEISEELTTAGRVLFVARHGSSHTIAPHRINYRANVWALHALGARSVIAINAVGGITPGMTAGRFVIPDQLIDYSWGRAHTFFEEGHDLAHHVDFTHPYDASLSQLLARSANASGVEFRHGGVYGCTQGPRLETAAEIRRMQRDGCDIVGMTGMPEAALAREIGLRYAMLALVVNRAAGVGDVPVTVAAMREVLLQGADSIRNILSRFLDALS